MAQSLPVRYSERLLGSLYLPSWTSSLLQRKPGSISPGAGKILSITGGQGTELKVSRMVLLSSTGKKFVNISDGGVFKGTLQLFLKKLAVSTVPATYLAIIIFKLQRGTLWIS